MERGEIPIVGIDKKTNAFLGDDGNCYFEVDNAIFVKDGIIEEGRIACHASGSHGGHIVLKPFYVRENGQWVNMYMKGRQHG